MFKVADFIYQNHQKCDTNTAKLDRESALESREGNEIDLPSNLKLNLKTRSSCTALTLKDHPITLY